LRVGGGLLNRYAVTLINKGRLLEAVELYRCANRPTDAAILIAEIAENVTRYFTTDHR